MSPRPISSVLQHDVTGEEVGEGMERARRRAGLAGCEPPGAAGSSGSSALSSARAASGPARGAATAAPWPWPKHSTYVGRNPLDRYLTFCEKMRAFAEHAWLWVRRGERPLLKVIDEYNYAQQTKGWR